MTTPTPSYKIIIFNKTTERYDYALLEPAEESDIPDLWTCAWKDLWEAADFGCEAIIKFTYQGTVMGLIRFGFYPYHGIPLEPEYVYVDNIETAKDKDVKPVGQWLLWYATKLALRYCVDNGGSVMGLDSVVETIPYYRDKIGMTGIKWKSGASKEDLYAFKFDREGAEKFTRAIEREYGYPGQIG